MTPQQTETQLMTDIRLALGGLMHTRMFRNQRGVGWVGRYMGRRRGLVTLANARAVTMGLFSGSADLIGWTSITITPDMVGMRVAVFTSGEVKKPGEDMPEHQVSWRNAVHTAGGFADSIESVEDALRLVRAP